MTRIHVNRNETVTQALHRIRAQESAQAARALQIVKTLAHTDPKDWASKTEIHAALTEFRS